MITDFADANLYVVFTQGLGANPPPARVVGPFRVVRWGAKGLWAYGDPAPGDAIPEAVRIATHLVFPRCASKW